MSYNISEPIYIRDDGTYEIQFNGMPYHADGNTDQRSDAKELIEAIKEYCAENSITPGAKPVEVHIVTADEVRSKRDGLINAYDKRVRRYEREEKLSLKTTETETVYKNLLGIIQELCDVPEQKGFPTNVIWPKEV